MGQHGQYGALVALSRAASRAASEAAGRAVSLLRFALPFAWALAGAAVAADCRTALAIGLDVSRSVDPAEMALQSEGLARALVDPDVVRAFLAPRGGPVRLAVYDWSGLGTARIVSPWLDIRSEADLAAAAAAIRAGPAGGGGRTALGGAMLAGAALLAQQRTCGAMILDLTVDGFSNEGPPPGRIAAQAFRGITVNALVIAEEQGSGEEPSLARLLAYFEEEVIRGPGAFAEPARGFANFERAMVRKLLQELGDAEVAALPAPALRLAGSGGS